AYSSLDEAIVHIANNPDTLSNDFRPGYYYDSDSEEAEGWTGLDRWADGRSDEYENNYPTENEYDTKGQYMYGLQTVGSKSYYDDYYYYYGYGGYGGSARQWTPMFTQAKLDESNFLAYVVQVEEDRVNEKILEMTGRNDWKGTINGIRDYKNIRDRDAFFAQNADAQAGRVMRDIHGNWVRVQQYILRPDASTVKVLNVSLREAGGDLSGMSTIDFTTQFMSDIPAEQSLRSLPWGEYLSTYYEDNGAKYIHYHSHEMYEGPFAPAIDNMYVKFTNPGSESVQESRSFFGQEPFNSEGTSCREQYVKAETLALINNVNSPITYTNTFFEDHGTPAYSYISHFGYRDPSDPEYGQGPGYYASTDGIFDGEDTKILDVNIHAVRDDYSGYSDFSEVPNEYDHYEIWAGSYDGTFDIWNVLATNEDYQGTIPWDGSIEIIMNRSDFFKKPIDTIYIPMSHMLWSGSNDYYPPPS
nr:hypothetical protein [Desulfobacteraceae bacterium]